MSRGLVSLLLPKVTASFHPEIVVAHARFYVVNQTFGRAPGGCCELSARSIRRKVSQGGRRWHNVDDQARMGRNRAPKSSGIPRLSCQSFYPLLGSAGFFGLVMWLRQPESRINRVC